MNPSKFRSALVLMASMLCAAAIAQTHSAASVAAPIGSLTPAPTPSLTPSPAPTEGTHSADWDRSEEQSDRDDDVGDHDQHSDSEDHDDSNVRGDRGRSHRVWHNRYYRPVHHGDDVVNVGADSILPAGHRADSVVSIFGSSTSEGEAADVVSVFGNTRVSGAVRDSAVAVLGNTYVDSKVDGDAVAVLGNVELGPHAEIGGDVVAVAGKVLRDPAAIVHGDSESFFGGNVGGVHWLHSWVEHCLFYGRPLSLAQGLGWAWGVALVLLAFYTCLALVFRSGITRCVETFETQPGHSILAALITTLLSPVLIVLLCITLVGIAAVPFIVIALLCLGLFGKAVILAWAGRRIAGRYAVGTLDHPAVAVLIGGALVLVLYLVPVLGFVVYRLLGLLGLGAVVYTLILALRGRQAAKQGADSAASPSAMPGATTAGATPAGASVTGASMAGAGLASATMAGPAPTIHSAAAAAQVGVPNESGLAGSSAGVPPAPSPVPSSVAAGLPRAGFWVRMAALLLDVLLVGIVTSVLHSIFDLHLVLLGIYGAVMWKLRGSTVGGIVFDLRVVRLDGREMDWKTAIVRGLSCFLSLAVAGLGFFWIAFDDAKQAWHDKIAGTVVVRVPKAVSPA